MNFKRAITYFLFLGFGVASLSANYSGLNPSPAFLFPIDGGRKVEPELDPPKGLVYSIGYLTVSSIDSEGALNSAADQQSVNQLLKQVEQTYAQIYKKHQGAVGSRSMSTTSPSYQNNQGPNNNCSSRKSPRWR